MPRFSVAAFAAVVVLAGAGCSDPLPQTATPTSPAASQSTPHPQEETPSSTAPELQIDTLLGIRLPENGLATVRDPATIKQEGSLFYGQAYRLVSSEDELVGRVQILNLTDPYRKPRTALNDPMRVLLGCGSEDVNYGPACDFGRVATSTVNGMNIGTYVVTYYPQGNDGRGDDVSVTTMVWLVPVPKNPSAWLYVYPADLERPELVYSLEGWMAALKPVN